MRVMDGNWEPTLPIFFVAFFQKNIPNIIEFMSNGTLQSSWQTTIATSPAIPKNSVFIKFAISVCGKAVVAHGLGRCTKDYGYV